MGTDTISALGRAQTALQRETAALTIFGFFWNPIEAQRSGFDGERRGKGAQWGMPEGRFPWSGLCPDDGGLLVLMIRWDLIVLLN